MMRHCWSVLFVLALMFMGCSGINVSQELRQTVGMNDLDELEEETRMQLPEMDFNDPYQKAMAESIFAGHGQGPKMFEAFLRVQTLWDESMVSPSCLAQRIRNLSPVA